MSDTKAILVVNFFGLGVLLFLCLLGMYSLRNADVPVGLFGFAFLILLLVYFSAMMIWNWDTYNAHNRNNYGENHMRNAVLILIFGVVGPGVLLAMSVS